MTTSTDPSRHTNRLIHETSPYLLQHAHNPVDWYPWGEEALARAQAENKPILLSIGYSACHWCHVMERESFERRAIARLMNEHFVCIKVDREERPDLDDIYMAATLAMNHGQGGWPMTVFLTPDQQPFFAGTYFPPPDDYGRPGFTTLLERIAELWRRDRHDLVAAGGRAHGAPAAAGRPVPAGTSARRRCGRRARSWPRPSTRATAASGPRPSSPRPRALAPAPPPPANRRRRTRSAMVTQDPRRHGAGRHVRPRRRRLRALLHRRALAGAALREDAVRQRAARARLPGGLPGHGRCLLRADRPRDARLRPARDDRPRGRLLLRDRRRLRGRGGKVLRLDAGRGGGGPGPRRGRPVLRLLRHHRRRQLGGQEHPEHAAHAERVAARLGVAGRRPAEHRGRPRAGSTRRAASAFRPGSTTRSSRRGTA